MDKYKLLVIILVAIIITFVAVIIMYHSRIERKDIVRKIKELKVD